MPYNLNDIFVSVNNLIIDTSTEATLILNYIS
jgi:hypothetical protein